MTEAYGELPSFIKQDDNYAFTVESFDTADLGTYMISIIGTVTQADPVSAEMLIEVRIENGCETDQIQTSTLDQDQIIYEIASSSLVSIFPSWGANTVEGCPIEYVLMREVDGSLQQLTSQENDLIKLDATDNSILIENIDDMSVKDQSWTIVAIKRSTFSKD